MSVSALRTLRERAGLGLSELARQVGVNPAHLWRVEAGLAGISVKTARLLANALAQALGLPPGLVLQSLIENTLPEEIGLYLPERRGFPRYLGIREAAAYLGVSVDFLKKAWRSGLLVDRGIPGPRGKTLFSVEELDRFARRYLEVNREAEVK